MRLDDLIATVLVLIMALVVWVTANNATKKRELRDAVTVKPCIITGNVVPGVGYTRFRVYFYVADKIYCTDLLDTNDANYVQEVIDVYTEEFEDIYDMSVDKIEIRYIQ